MRGHVCFWCKDQPDRGPTSFSYKDTPDLCTGGPRRGRGGGRAPGRPAAQRGPPGRCGRGDGPGRGAPRSRRRAREESDDEQAHDEDEDWPEPQRVRGAGRARIAVRCALQPPLLGSHSSSWPLLRAFWQFRDIPLGELCASDLSLTVVGSATAWHTSRLESSGMCCRGAGRGGRAGPRAGPRTAGRFDAGRGRQPPQPGRFVSATGERLQDTYGSTVPVPTWLLPS